MVNQPAIPCRAAEELLRNSSTCTGRTHAAHADCACCATHPLGSVFKAKHARLKDRNFARGPKCGGPRETLELWRSTVEDRPPHLDRQLFGTLRYVIDATNLPWKLVLTVLHLRTDGRRLQK